MTGGSEPPFCLPKDKGAVFSFVDLENIRLGLHQFLDRKKVPVDRRIVFSTERLIQSFRSDRVFVYSAVEDKNKSDQLVQSLRSEPGIIFKSAKLTVNAGRRKQQGVDVLLAIEALKHAYSKNIAACNLFSGDGDFLPLIEALVDHGIIVTTICFGDPAQSDVASSLRDASDGYYQIGSKILFRSMRAEHGWSSSGSQEKASLLRNSTEIETSFPELAGRVLKLSDGDFYLVSDQTPLENASKDDHVQGTSFRSLMGLEEWFRISN